MGVERDFVDVVWRMEVLDLPHQPFFEYQEFEYRVWGSPV